MIGLPFPEISPIAVSFGPVAIRWYSLAYLFGIILAYMLVLRVNKKYDLGFEKKQIEDLAFYVTLGIIVGGRLGYAVFYGGAEMWLKPWRLFELWKGGMSFHGGIAGVVIAAWLFAKKYGFKFLQITDLIVLFAPIGILLGRITNFINDELWGRVTDVPWAVRFPSGGFVPRHPSQLYEAFMEGFVLFVLLNAFWSNAKIRQNAGVVSAMFAILYGIFRMCMEQFREPDRQLGFFFNSITMGQMLSLPLIIAGAIVLLQKLKEKN